MKTGSLLFTLLISCSGWGHQKEVILSDSIQSNVLGEDYRLKQFSKEVIDSIHVESIPTFLEYLDEKKEKGSTYWIENESLRFLVIERLSEIIEIQYKWWTDSKEFKSSMDSINTVSSNRIYAKQLIYSCADSIVVMEHWTNCDNELYGLTIEEFKYLEWVKYRKWLFFDRWDLMFIYLEMDNNQISEQQVAVNLSVIKKHATIQYLMFVYKDQMVGIDDPRVIEEKKRIRDKKIEKFEKKNVKRQEKGKEPLRYKTLEGCSKNISKEVFTYVTPFIKDRNRSLLSNALALYEKKHFVHYRSPDVSLEKIKEIDMYMDNDVLVPGGFNQDREMTGGGALTVSTDYFPARWFNIGWFRYLLRKTEDWSRSAISEPHRLVMNYQSVSLKMNFYTPYIRYRDNIPLADTMFTMDRPFGSYIHIDRDKYRLWPKGLIRHHGSFQIGMIGSNAGRDIQAMLHRDAVVESQKVYGWENQIAKGGRWLIQANHTFDFLLLSSSNEYRSVFVPNWKNHNKNRSFFNHFGLNVVATGEAMFGGFLTAVGGGLRISTVDFTKMGGQKTVKPFKNNVYNFAITAEVGIRYRYVFHNSMLEGFGYITTYTDDQYDNESLSPYTLNQVYYNSNEIKYKGNSDKRYARTPKVYDQINRELLLLDFRLNIRFRKMTVYWNFTINEHEYKEFDIDFSDQNIIDKIPNTSEDLDYYNNTVVPELIDYRKKKFYGYGTVGVSWLM